MSRPPLHHYFHGCIYTEVLRAALRLKIFDHIGDDSCSLEEVEKRCATERPRVLKALLLLLCEMGALEQSRGRFRNTSDGQRLLRSRSNEYRGDLVEHVATVVLQELEKAHHELFFSDKPSALAGKPWKDDATRQFFGDEASANAFARYAGPVGFRAGDELARHFDFGGIERVVDVGGNDGSFLVSLLKRHRHLTGIVVDIPVVKNAAEGCFRRHGLADGGRIEFLAHNFFAAPLPDADCYVSGFVLHDWHDESSAVILKNVWNALPVGGLLILHEDVLDDPMVSRRLSIARGHYHLVATGEVSFGAAGEKSSVEYSVWLASLGFAVEQILWTPVKSFLFARKRAGPVRPKIDHLWTVPRAYRLQLYRRRLRDFIGALRR